MSRITTTLSIAIACFAFAMSQTAVGQAPAVAPIAIWPAHALGVDQAVLSADGSIAVALGMNAEGAGSLKWFQVKDQKVITETPASAKISRVLAINARGNRVAWFADEKAPTIANLATAKVDKKLTSPEQAFSRGGYLAFAQDGKQLLAIDNSRLYQWNTETAAAPKLLDLKRIVYAFAAFPKSDRAIIGHEEGNWRLLAIADRTVQAFDQPTSFEALEAAVRKGGEQFVARNYEDSVFVWNVDPLEKAGELSGTANLGRGICFCPSGSHILAPTGQGDTLSLFENPSGKVSAQLTGLGKFITDARFSADGKFVIGGDRQGKVAVWDVSKIVKLEVTRPEMRMRTWASIDGGYKIEARFLSATATTVRLERADGTLVEVAINKLSRDDQALIRAINK